MSKKALLLLGACAAALACQVAVTSAPAAQAQVHAADRAESVKIVAAADAFIATLDPAQRKQVIYPYGDEQQRARWSNFPTGFVPRGGLSLKQMTPAQRAAAEGLLAAVLSPMGVDKVRQIRQADDDFKLHGSKRGPRGSGAGPGAGAPAAPLPGGKRPPFDADAMFGSDLYFISFLGQPSASAPWMLQFGGHHLALNISFGAGSAVMTPSLTGAQPASFSDGGKTVRPLGRESDKALALLQSLDARQKQQAVLTYQVADLVLGPGQDGRRIAPEGIRATALTASQRAMLLDLIAEWSGMINPAAASARMAQLTAELDATWFAWSGPQDASAANKAGGNNIGAYFRIQGPHLVIEYAPQHDEPANHVHTIYRDPGNDYGRAPATP